MNIQLHGLRAEKKIAKHLPVFGTPNQHVQTVHMGLQHRVLPRGFGLTTCVGREQHWKHFQNILKKNVRLD